MATKPSKTARPPAQSVPPSSTGRVPEALAGRVPEGLDRGGTHQARALGPLTVAHLDEAMLLVEALIDETEDLFIAKGQKYRARHRAATERPLTAQEAASIASAMASGHGLPPVPLAIDVQQSGLRGYEEPEPVEILLSAGIATAPAFMNAVKRFVALIELPADDLEAAIEGGRLKAVLDDAVRAMRSAPLDGPGGARERARAALEHFSAAAGAAPGKAVSLLPRALWQGVQQAMTSLGYVRGSASLIGSPPSTAGPDETSSTEPAMSTP